MSAQLKKQCTELYEKISEIDDEEEKLEVTITWAKSLVKNALKKSEKVKKVKIPGAPPKGTNAFMIFCEEKRGEYKEENPEATTGEITKMIADQWNEHRDAKNEVFDDYNQKLADRKEAYKAFLEENGIEEESKGSKSKTDKPTRAPSAYNLFMKEQQPIVKEENPDAGQKDIMKIIGGKWSELSADEKAEYKPKDAAAPKKGKEVAKEAPKKGKGKATDSEDEEPKKAKQAPKKGKGKAADSEDEEPKKAKEAPKKGKGKAADSDDEKAPKKGKGKATDSEAKEEPKKGKEAPKKVKDAPKKAKIIVEDSDEE